MNMTYIDRNLASVRAALCDAAQKAGRDAPPCVVAAIKYASDEELVHLLALGLGDVGENRVQQLLAHWPLLENSGARVHFIGSLQKNKVKYIVDKVAMIHSVDTAELAAEIDRRAGAKGICMPVLIELNVAREESKSGALPEQAEALCQSVLALPHLCLKGFMTMGPRFESEAAYRRFFAETRELAYALWQRLSLQGTPVLSMGMSESFTAAACEGAAFVRVGRGLFAGREEQNEEK